MRAASRRWDERLLEQLTIRDKQARLAPLALNPGQRMVLRAMQAQRDAGAPVRIVLLKARQFGGSTLAQACLFADAAHRPLRESWIVAHTLDSARALFGMAQRFYRHYPPASRAKPLRCNSSELVLPNHSRITAATAETAPAGRGFTLHNLHASETAWWRRAGESMLSLLQAVPDHPDTCVIVESTANGMGGYFHDLWRAARAGQNGFEPVFVGWNTVAEYSAPFGNSDLRRRFRDSLSPEESALYADLGLTLEQLQWRRSCIRDKCGGSVDAFRQEYPLHDQEAFLTSGRPVFQVGVLDSMYLHCDAPILRAEIDMEPWLGRREQAQAAHGPNALDLARHLCSVRSGRLKIWHHPEPGARYVLGVDVAEGIEVSPGGRERDNSCVQMLHCGRMEQVACWTGKIDPDVLADVVLFLSEYYNRAFCGVEANNHGLTTLTLLKNRYPNLYRREVFDERSRRRTHKLGWLTTAATRPLMIDALGRVLRERTLQLHDQETVSECMTFVFDRNGRMDAQEGCFDDRVMALAIAVQMHMQGPAAAPGVPAASPMEERLEFLKSLRGAGQGASRNGWNVI